MKRANLFTYSLVLLMALLIFQGCNQGSSSRSSEAIHEKYFNLFPEAAVGSLKKVDNERERQAFLLYHNGHLDKAAESFLSIYQDYGTPRHLFYAAVSNQYENKIDLAIAQYEQLAAEAKISMKFPYQYYQGLAYLQADDKEKAKQAFSSVKSNFNYYKSRSDTLLTLIQ